MNWIQQAKQLVRRGGRAALHVGYVVYFYTVLVVIGLVDPELRSRE